MNSLTGLTWLFEHRGTGGKWELWTKQGVETSKELPSWADLRFETGQQGGGGLPALFHKSADSFQPENVLRNPGSFPAVTYLGSLKDFFFFL